MTRPAAVVGAIVMAAVLGTSGCSNSGHAGPTTSPAEVHHLDASWADAYTTVNAMTEHADVVVEGVVTQVSARGQFHNTSVNTRGAPDGVVPYTDYRFTVTETLKGSHVSDIIVIRQTGGRASDGSTVEITDDPLLAVGDREIVFLKRFAANDYFIMGGPAGRFPVSKSGAVTEMPDSTVTDAPHALVAFMNAVRSSA